MKILIAVDGSSHTQKALDYLATHRATFVEGNELIVLHVCMGLPGHVVRHLGKGLVTDYYTDEAAKVMAPVKARLATHGISGYATEYRHGHVADEILKAARTAGAGLIVMGTQGHGLFGRALMGSVAGSVVSATDIAVLLVR